MKPRLKESGARSEPLQVSWLAHRGFIWVWIWGGLASESLVLENFSITLMPQKADDWGSDVILRCSVQHRHLRH